ncbi:MAG: hypothetical protein DWQ29_07565 [Planctomycetota bacterium]|nr:MAG: hypothetical protein DWQ29_07565 [Planctomycetota bacterium]
MLEENGFPMPGQSAVRLGIRPGRDIAVDANGLVHRPAFHAGGKNGLSCAPELLLLPPFALPIKFGGSHKKTEVWRIKNRDLPSDLMACQDGPRHVSIGPNDTMTFLRFVELIRRTAPAWAKVS